MEWKEECGRCALVSKESLPKSVAVLPVTGAEVQAGAAGGAGNALEAVRSHPPSRHVPASTQTHQQSTSACPTLLDLHWPLAHCGFHSSGASSALLLVCQVLLLSLAAQLCVGLLLRPAVVILLLTLMFAGLTGLHARKDDQDEVRPRRQRASVPKSSKRDHEARGCTVYDVPTVLLTLLAWSVCGSVPAWPEHESGRLHV